jgi:DNA-binding PadR family transcriptional regulator
MGKDGLGEFEHLVLLAILTLGSDAYGVSILEELHRRTGRRVTRAAMRRLEAKGWVRSQLGAPTAERGGRAKRFFKVTPSGLGRLRHVRRALLGFWTDLAQLDPK